MNNFKLSCIIKLTKRLIIGVVLFLAVFYAMSPRFRQHIAFNYNQLEILVSLNDRNGIHHESNFIIPKVLVHDSSIISDVLKEILRNKEVSSQRLIYGYHEHLNLNYKSYVLLNTNPRINLPDPGRFINEEVLTKTHNYFEFGLGGIQLFPSILIKFTTIKEMDDYIDDLREKYSVYKQVKVNNVSYLVKLSPFFFIDWYWYPVGINSNLILGYNDVNINNINNKIIKSEIDGIFGPNIDYTQDIMLDYDEILNFTLDFTDAKKITFAKHFGYRRSFIKSINGDGIDPHYQQVRVVTPKEQFEKEDLKLYNKLMSDVDSKYLGVMVGHHFLDPVDPMKMANSSTSVIDLVRGSTKGVTISDAIGMSGFLKGGLFEDLVPQLKTDLILLNYFDLDKMRVMKTVVSSDSSFSNSKIMARILKLKLDKELLKIYVLD